MRPFVFFARCFYGAVRRQVTNASRIPLPATNGWRATACHSGPMAGAKASPSMSASISVTTSSSARGRAWRRSGRRRSPRPAPISHIVVAPREGWMRAGRRFSRRSRYRAPELRPGRCGVDLDFLGTDAHLGVQPVCDVYVVKPVCYSQESRWLRTDTILINKKRLQALHMQGGLMAPLHVFRPERISQSSRLTPTPRPNGIKLSPLC